MFKMYRTVTLSVVVWESKTWLSEWGKLHRTS